MLAGQSQVEEGCLSSCNSPLTLSCLLSALFLLHEEQVLDNFIGYFLLRIALLATS